MVPPEDTPDEESPFGEGVNDVREGDSLIIEGELNIEAQDVDFQTPEGGGTGEGGGGGQEPPAGGSESPDDNQGDEQPVRGPGFVSKFLRFFNQGLGPAAEASLNRGRFNPINRLTNMGGDEPSEGGILGSIERRINTAFSPENQGVTGAIARNKLLSGSLQALGGPGKVFLEGTIRALGATVDKIGEQLNDFNDINERLAVINTNLATVTEGNTAALADSTMGFGLAAKALAELRIAGFEETNVNLIDLTSRLKISGQNTGAIINLSKQLIGIGGLQESSVDSLATTIIQSSKVYGVTMDSIIEAVDGLSDNLKSLNVMGGGQGATEITAMLAGIMDEELIPQVSFIMKELTSTAGDLNTQAALGMERFGDLISTGQLTAANMPEILMNLQMISQRARGFVEANDGSRRQLAASFGGQNELVMTLASLAPALAEATTAPRQSGDALMKTVTAFNEIALGDFKRVVSNMLPAFMVLLKGLASTIGGFLSLITRIFAPVVNFFMAVGGLVLNAIGLVAQALAGIVETAWDALSLIPGLSYFFGDGDVNATDAFDQVGKMFNAFFSDLSEQNANQRNLVATTQALSQSTGAIADARVRDISTTDIVRREMMRLTETNMGLLSAAEEQNEIARRAEVAKEKEILSRIKPVDEKRDILTAAAMAQLDRQARQVDSITNDMYMEALRKVFGESIQDVIIGLRDVETATRANKTQQPLKT